MIIKLVGKWRMAILNPLEHLLQVLVIEVHRYRSTVRTVKGILTLRKTPQEGLSLPIIKVVVSLDRPFTAQSFPELYPPPDLP